MILGRFMPSCREVADSLAQGDMADIPRRKRLLIRMHLSMCVHCSRFARQMELIAKALREHWARSSALERLEMIQRRLLARLGSRDG